MLGNGNANFPTLVNVIFIIKYFSVSLLVILRPAENRKIKKIVLDFDRVADLYIVIIIEATQNDTKAKYNKNDIARTYTLEYRFFSERHLLIR